MNIDDAYPSKYLSAADLQGRESLCTIRDCRSEDVSGGEDQDKPVLYFESKNKGLALNRTNANTIKAAFGPETDHWLGRRIVIYPSTTDYKGKIVDCLRVRVPTEAIGPTDPEPPPASYGGPHKPVHEDDIPF